MSTLLEMLAKQRALAAATASAKQQAAESKPVLKLDSPVKPAAAPMATPTPKAAQLPAVIKSKDSPLLAAAKEIQSRMDEKRTAVQKDYSFLVDNQPKDFQEVLDRFDALLKRDTGIDDYNIDSVRSYCKTIFTELKTDPNLEGMIIDRDVANIIHFIRTTRERAGVTIVEKSAKAAKRVPKDKAISLFGGMVLDLNAPIAGMADLAGFEDLP